MDWTVATVALFAFLAVIVLIGLLMGPDEFAEPRDATGWRRARRHNERVQRRAQRRTERAWRRYDRDAVVAKVDPAGVPTISGEWF